jgi:phosphatidylglycerophosphate synthase
MSQVPVCAIYWICSSLNVSCIFFCAFLFSDLLIFLTIFIGSVESLLHVIRCVRVSSLLHPSGQLGDAKFLCMDGFLEYLTELANVLSLICPLKCILWALRRKIILCILSGAEKLLWLPSFELALRGNFYKVNLLPHKLNPKSLE